MMASAVCSVTSCFGIIDKTFQTLMLEVHEDESTLDGSSISDVRVSSEAMKTTPTTERVF
jgi:hypothetical protein